MNYKIQSVPHTKLSSEDRIQVVLITFYGAFFFQLDSHDHCKQFLYGNKSLKFLLLRSTVKTTAYGFETT